MADRQLHGSSGCSIGGLFLLTAVCAVLLALVAPVASQPEDAFEGLLAIAIAGGAGSLALGLIGLVVGLFQFRVLRGMLGGGLVGLAVGLVVGPLVFLPIERLSWLLGTALGGSAIVLLSAVVIGSRSRHRPPAADGGSDIVRAEVVDADQ